MSKEHSVSIGTAIEAAITIPVTIQNMNINLEPEVLLKLLEQVNTTPQADNHADQ